MITTGEAWARSALHIPVYPRDGSRRKNRAPSRSFPRENREIFLRKISAGNAAKPAQKLRYSAYGRFQRNTALRDDREFFENMPTIKFFTWGREIRVFRGYPHFGPPLHGFERVWRKGRKKRRMDRIRRLLTAGLSRRALKFREIEWRKGGEGKNRNFGRRRIFGKAKMCGDIWGSYRKIEVRRGGRERERKKSGWKGRI